MTGSSVEYRNAYNLERKFFWPAFFTMLAVAPPLACGLAFMVQSPSFQSWAAKVGSIFPLGR